MTHYKGQCYAWDVVNEALESDGSFRESVFFKTIGESYIKIAFDIAAAADPDVKLYYNDFSIENPGPKATGALNIVKSLKASGTKIDGVGLQAHFIVGSTPSKAVQIKNLESFTALGVEVAYTELDIRMTLPSTPDLDAQQTTDYQDTVAACVQVTNCIGVTVWDFSDKVESVAFLIVPSILTHSSTPGFQARFLERAVLYPSTRTWFGNLPTLVLLLGSQVLL
jgi:endo-1,4-beta-xylanase